MFHRLVPPVYYGGLPGGVDYLNTPSLSGGSGVPALMDGQKVSGPNDGTYFFAFGEDATSDFFNRGLQALGENTDELDDLMRRDLSMPARTLDVTAGAPVSSVTLTGQVFVGAFGIPNTQPNRDLLVSILDSNDNEIIDSAGVKVVASWIHDGSNNNVVGMAASGFYNGPRVTCYPPIPTGTTYRVYYGERSNLATMPMDAFTTMRIRGAEEVSAEVERMLKSLHSSYVGVTWTDPWVATINSLARTGLDGRYRLSTYDNYASPPLDTPGAGASITRDGSAVRMVLPVHDFATYGGLTAPYVDPFLACFALVHATEFIDTQFNVDRGGGDIGLMQLSPRHSTYDANEVASDHITGPLLFEATPRNITASTLLGDAVITRIGSGLTATLNPDSGTTQTARRTVQLNAVDYFQDASYFNTIRRSIDLLEVTEIASGTVIGVFTAETFPTRTRAQLLSPTGSATAIGTSGVATPVRVRWIQPTVCIGGSRSAYWGSSGIPQMYVAQPSGLVDNWDTNATEVNAVFLSAYGGYHRANGATSTSFNNFAALAWGGFGPDGWPAYVGYLEGDGGINCGGGRQLLNFIGRNREGFSAGATGRTVHYYIGSSGNFAEIYTSGAAWGAATFNFTLHETAGYVAQGGDEFDLMFHIPPASAGPIVLNWVASVVFSGADGVVPSSNPGGSTITTYYKFIYSTTLGAWVATRTDY